MLTISTPIIVLAVFLAIVAIFVAQSLGVKKADKTRDEARKVFDEVLRVHGETVIVDVQPDVIDLGAGPGYYNAAGVFVALQEDEVPPVIQVETRAFNSAISYAIGSFEAKVAKIR